MNDSSNNMPNAQHQNDEIGFDHGEHTRSKLDERRGEQEGGVEESEYVSV